MFAFFQFTSIKVNPYSKAERKKVGHSVHNFRDTKPIGKRNSYGKAERKKWDTVSTISEMQSP